MHGKDASLSMTTMSMKLNLQNLLLIPFLILPLNSSLKYLAFVFLFSAKRVCFLSKKDECMFWGVMLFSVLKFERSIRFLVHFVYQAVGNIFMLQRNEKPLVPSSFLSLKLLSETFLFKFLTVHFVSEYLKLIYINYLPLRFMFMIVLN